MKNRCCFRGRFGDVFLTFRPPFLSRFGVIFGDFSPQKGARSEKRDFHEMLGITMVFQSFLRSEGSKMTSFLVPGATFSTSENRLIFVIDF